MKYGPRFFNSIREGSQRSAAAVVPHVVGRFEPKTVVDIGCGEGLWGKAFEDAGCEVLGLDGHPDPVIQAQSVDLTDMLPTFERRFDLAVCLEVAEHLPPLRAETFIAELCGLSNTILFSAAVPGQGGTGHRNEQWPQYWADLFAERGFACSDDLRWEIWGDDRICWWYRQNLMVATAGSLPRAESSTVQPVIHPGAWAHFGH
jgi:hypothetical protein